MMKKSFLFLVFATNIFVIYAQDIVYSLQECVKIALENNLSVQRSKLNQKISEIDITQSKMNRYPNLNLNLNLGRNWGRSIDPTSNQFISQKINSIGFNGSSSVTLFNGFQISNTIKQSSINLEAANYDLENVKNNVAFSVINLYLSVIFNKELEGNAIFQLNSTNKQLQRIQKLVDAGSLPITNLLDLQAQLASDEVNLINAENNYNFTLLQLKQALLIPVEDPFEIEMPDIQVESIDVSVINTDEVYKIAESNQPQIKNADLNVKVSELGYKISKGAYMPTLSLNAGFRTNYSGAIDRARPVFKDGFTITGEKVSSAGYFINNRGTIINVLEPVYKANNIDPNYTPLEQFNDNFSRFLSLNLSIPIFNNWRTRLNVQRSTIEKQRSEINAKEIRNQLRQTIETSINDLLATSKSFNASEKRVKALEESHRVIEKQYNLGIVNFVDFQVSSNNLFIAKSDLVRAKYDYIFKRKVLDFYMGKLLLF